MVQNVRVDKDRVKPVNIYKKIAEMFGTSKQNLKPTLKPKAGLSGNNWLNLVSKINEANSINEISNDKVSSQSQLKASLNSN